MMKGKELLINIINSKLSRLNQIDFSAYFYNDINLVDLSRELKNDIFYFGHLSDDVIKEVLSDTDSTGDIESLKLIRDLFVGKKDYAIDVDLNDNYKSLVKNFIKELDNKLDSYQPGISRFDEVQDKCNLLLHQIKNNELIEDTEFIKELVEDYDIVDATKNMLSIMIYITKNNINLVNGEYHPSKYVVDIDKIVDNTLDDRIKIVLDRLGLSIDDLPRKVIEDLKTCNIDNFVKVYDIVRKNKVEKYGILHLIDKENKLSRLALILYSTPDAIKEVVDSVKESNKHIDTLKVLLNNALPIFFVKDNSLFVPHYFDYVLLINLLKELNINYRDLINRCPLFVLSNYKDINYVLNEMAKLGFDKKKVINRCYKQLSINPEKLLDNVNIIKTFGIDTFDYANNDLGKYIMIKCSGLYNKLDYIANNNKMDHRNFDYNLANKIIVSKTVKECNKKNLWSDD